MTAEAPPLLRSAIDGLVWPALPEPRGMLLLALLRQLRQSERWTGEALLERQMLQLSALLQHAWQTVPFYRERLAGIGYRPGDRVGHGQWRRLPLLTRRDLQSAGPALRSTADFGPLGGTAETQSSGSTGEPVKVGKTLADQIMWDAITLREHLWHRRDFGGKLAAIRYAPPGSADPPGGAESPDWGHPVSTLWATGPAAKLNLYADVETQARWLLRHDPDYLLTYPSGLAALLEHFAARGLRLPRLRQVRTVGETVSPALRNACRERWGVPLVDNYSSQEMGYIALQCPESGQYHVMAESVLVEVLDEAGEPCGPGEVGRVVVTSLHNLATPLLRYELRDYAEQGAPCSCGRGLPTLARILGRSRNLVTLPSGRRRWPVVGYDRYRELAPVSQYQLVQHSLEEIEVRLVVERPLREDEEAALAAVVREALGHPFRLRFSYFEREIPRGAGGKFEEFVSLLDVPA